MASLANALFGQITAYAWPPVVSLSRRTIISVLSRVTQGQLVLADSTENVVTVCGLLEQRSSADPDKSRREETVPKAPRAELRVVNEVFWVRLLLFGDMVCGFAIDRSFHLAFVLLASKEPTID